MERTTIVLYPGLAVSHFVPMMELAKVLLEHGHAVTVAFIDRPNKPPGLAAAVDHVVSSSSHPSFSFHKLPPPAAGEEPRPPAGEDFIVTYYNLIRAHNGRLRSFLRSLPLRRARALVVDAFSFDALDVARELGVAAYAFYPAGAAALAVYLQLPPMAASILPASFRELGDDDASLEFVGVVPPIPVSHLSREMRERPESEVYNAALSRWARLPTDTDGILVDTFESLEPSAARALRDPAGFLLAGCRALPPVFCVGPLVQTPGARKQSTRRQHECLSWLDGQPDRSVVYLCFGSAGVHREEQLLEIATGLEMSGHRFLWVIQAPKKNQNQNQQATTTNDVLPEGFLERTQGRGLVVTSWAPQLEVLKHGATGAFVTHCGWNSVLEAVAAGVPMLCWPMYAEQKMNKVFLVEEMGIGVEVAGWEEGRLVGAGEVEAKVRMVMESARGEELRDRVAKHRAAAAAAWEHGGSSRAEIARFLSNVESGRRHEVK